LVPINLEMEWLHLLNKLEQLHHVDRRLFNQSIFIPHVEHVKPKATPTFVQYRITYPQGTSPTKLIFGLRERSQIPHHKLIFSGNQGVGTLTCSYCQ
jgi:hypothetical protein